MSILPIEAVLDDVRVGRPIVLIDDTTRENEGDLMVAAEKITPEVMSFMLNEGKGLVCISLTEERLGALGIPLQVQENTSLFGTNFAVSFDHRSVVDRGVTAEGRTQSILAAIREGSRPEDFVLPGYVFPVVAVEGGVLRRRGQTEGSVDLARIAGLNPSGVICEIMDADGKMVRGAALDAYCKKFNLKMTSVEELVQFRLRNEISVRRAGEFSLSTALGIGRSARLATLLANQPDALRVVVYVDDVDEKEHFAFVCGSPRNGCLVRIHSECLTGDVFASRRCDCGHQLDSALENILRAGEGVLVYLHQEGRGIGLGNKLRTYELQDQGYDTVDANVQLGFEVDSRDYRVGARILSDLDLGSVRLMTNNPEKVRSLESFGLKVLERVQLPICIDEHNRAYMLAKKQRLGHLFESG